MFFAQYERFERFFNFSGKEAAFVQDFLNIAAFDAARFFERITDGFQAGFFWRELFEFFIVGK